MRTLTTVVSLALLSLLAGPSAEAVAAPNDKSKICMQCW